MEAPLRNRYHWNSLPAVLSQPHMASSPRRDSSCASDDISDISMATTFTAITNLSSTLPELGIAIPHTPKQHYKCQGSAPAFDGYESGYESDGSEIESPEHVEFSEHVRQYLDGHHQNEDDIFDFEIHSNVPMEDEFSLYDHCGSGSDLEDEPNEDMGSFVDDFELEDSHIEFGNSVHFDAAVSYIESPELSDREEEGDPEMTMHEMMLLTQKNLLQSDNHVKTDNHKDVDNDEDVFSETSAADLIIKQLSGEYSRDMIEVDKSLFVAFINGIHGGTPQKYQSYLRDRVQGFRDGRFQSPFFESEAESTTGFFLDEALKHVIGMFRNIVLREEYDELVRLAERTKDQGPTTRPAENLAPDFLTKVEHILSERLLEGKAVVDKDELSFFADGIVYALTHPKIYAYDGAAVST